MSKERKIKSDFCRIHLYLFFWSCDVDSTLSVGVCGDPGAGQHRPVDLPSSTFVLNSSRLSLASVSPQFCGAIVTQLDIFLPLAVACSDSSLLEVRSSFVEACGQAAFAMMGRLRERALEVPACAPMKNLPALLSTCIYVHQQLQRYHDTLREPSNAAKM